MPTMAAVTTTAGYFLASKMGLITGNSPVVYWISATLVIVIIMIVSDLVYYCQLISEFILSLERTNLIYQEFRNL